MTYVATDISHYGDYVENSQSVGQLNFCILIQNLKDDPLRLEKK